MVPSAGHHWHWLSFSSSTWPPQHLLFFFSTDISFLRRDGGVGGGLHFRDHLEDKAFFKIFCPVEFIVQIFKYFCLKYNKQKDGRIYS